MIQKTELPVIQEEPVNAWIDSQKISPDRKFGEMFMKKRISGKNNIAFALNQSIHLLEELEIVDLGSKTIIYPDGSRYIGTLQNNQRSGFGMMTWKNGAMYKGNWQDGQPDSFGEYTWPDKRKYVGNYKDGKKDGFGIYYWPNGRKYEGDWVNDRFNGFGTLTWLSGSVFTGSWKSGLRHGHGKMTHWFGKITEGNYIEGKIHGLGTVLNTSVGIKWQGQFVDGQKNYLNGYLSPIDPIKNLKQKRQRRKSIVLSTTTSMVTVGEEDKSLDNSVDNSSRMNHLMSAMNERHLFEAAIIPDKRKPHTFKIQIPEKNLMMDKSNLLSFSVSSPKKKSSSLKLDKQAAYLYDEQTPTTAVM